MQILIQTFNIGTSLPPINAKFDTFITISFINRTLISTNFLTCESDCGEISGWQNANLSIAINFFKRSNGKRNFSTDYYYYLKIFNFLSRRILQAVGFLILSGRIFFFLYPITFFFFRILIFFLLVIRLYSLPSIRFSHIQAQLIPIESPRTFFSLFFSVIFFPSVRRDVCFLAAQIYNFTISL